MLKLIIRRRRNEIQRDTPQVDTAEALKRTVMSLINEGDDVDRLKEPTKRRQQKVHQDSDDEESEEEETEDVIELIVKRFIADQGSQEENTLKIEIAETPQPNSDEGEKVSQYMMLARFQTGQSSKRDETVMSLQN